MQATLKCQLKLLNRVQKRAVVARQGDVRRIFRVKGETRRDLDRRSCLLWLLLLLLGVLSWHDEG